jgi:preprotein translocase subunit SecG
MFTFLLVVQTIVAASLVTVILMQRSEGGGLGVGGSSSGFMTARGAADFLTRSTAILGALFVILSIVLAAVAGMSRQAARVDTSLVGDAPAQQAPALPPVGQTPMLGDRPVRPDSHGAVYFCHRRRGLQPR